MLVVRYTKMLYHNSIRQFTETLNQFFYLSWTNGNFETCMPVRFGQLKELKQF